MNKELLLALKMLFSRIDKNKLTLEERVWVEYLLDHYLENWKELKEISDKIDKDIRENLSKYWSVNI